MKNILVIIIGIVGFSSVAFAQFADELLSIDLAPSPSNGNCLTTDGTINIWGVCGTGGSSVSDWLQANGALTPTTSIGIRVKASSTISGLTVDGNENITGSSVVSSALGTGSLTVGNTLGSNGSQVRMLGFSGTYKNWQMDVGLTGTGAFNITPSTVIGGSSFATPALSILGSGNVGIGSTSPSRLLTVQGGDFYLGGNMTATGTASSSAIVASNSVDLFGGGTKTTANALCIQLTGSSALCDGSDDGGGGGGVSDWKQINGVLTPTTTIGVYIAERLGVGTATPPAIFAVASSTYDYNIPLFSVATSAQSLFQISATTSRVSSSTESTGGALVKVGVLPSYLRNVGNTSNLFVNGNVESTFDYFRCNPRGNLAVVSADTSYYCEDAGYQEDTAGAGTSVNSSVSIDGSARISKSLTARNPDANGGAGFFFDMSSLSNNPDNDFGRATPIFSVILRVSPGASSTVYTGFTNTNPSGTAFEVAPTQGAFFFASPSSANWKFSVVTSAVSSTTIETSFASTTPAFMRIEGDGSFISAFIGSSTNAMGRIATVSNNFTATTSLYAGTYMGNVLGGAINFDAFNMFLMELWSKKPYSWFTY